MADPIRQTVWPGTLLSVIVFVLCAIADVWLPFIWIAVLLAGILGAIGGYQFGKVKEGKRPIIFLAIVVLLLGGAACWLHFTWPIGRSHYNRIHAGMSLEDVKKILGSPDANFNEFELEGVWTEKQINEGRFAGCNVGALVYYPERYLPRNIRRWTSGRCVIAVSLDDQNHVLEKEYVEVYRRRGVESYWKDLLRQFKNQRQSFLLWLAKHWFG